MLDMVTVSFRLPETLARRVGKLARRKGLSASTLFRLSVERLVQSEELGIGQLIAAVVTYPGSGISDLGRNSERHLKVGFGRRRSG